MRTLRIILASLIVTTVVTTGCYGSAVGTPNEQGDTSSGDTKTGSTSKTSPAASASTGNKTTTAQSQTSSCTADAGACDQTQIPTKISVTIDGTTCAVKTTTIGNGLDMGLDTHGWTMQVEDDDCAGGFILEVSGLDNQAYPQSDAITFDQTPALQLFTNENDDGSDAGAGEAYLSASGSSLEIESGPVNHSAKTIKGNGTIQEQGGNHSHTVSFEMDF